MWYESYLNLKFIFGLQISRDETNNFSHTQQQSYAKNCQNCITFQNFYLYISSFLKVLLFECQYPEQEAPESMAITCKFFEDTCSFDKLSIFKYLF